MNKNINIMGGEVYFEIIGKNKKIEKEILNFCETKLNSLVNIFNFFDKNSLLSILNNKKKIKFNSHLSFLLEESIKLYKLTEGRFNIFLGEEIKQRKLNLEPILDKNSILDKDLILNKNSKKLVNLDINNLIKIEEDYIYLNSKNLKIDLGGIAKGYIVDEIIKLTKTKFKSDLKEILIDARGDIGIFSKTKSIIIGINNPFKKEYIYEFIKLKKGSIITSGVDKQIFKNGSHIIGDNKDILTITLISNFEKTYFLDAIGTYLIQLDSEKVLDLIEFNENFKEIESFIVLNNKEILKSGFWEAYVNG